MDNLDFSTKTAQSRPEVAVLIATYNGAGFLLQQLDSIVAQLDEDDFGRLQDIYGLA